MISLESGKDGEHPSHVFGRDSGHFFIAYAIAFGKCVQYLPDESALVALASVRNRCHIRTVGFENNAVKGDRCRQIFAKMAAFKRRDAAYTEAEFVKTEEGFSLFRIACKAMENTSGQLFLVAFQDMKQLVLGLSAMNHQRQLILNRPFHLLFKSLQLFAFKLTAPVKIKSTLADGNVTERRFFR